MQASDQHLTADETPARGLLWRSEDILTFYKESGIPVFPPHGAPEGDCALKRLLAAEPMQAAPMQAAVDWPEGFAGGIAHRLDNATSGLLLVARSLLALTQLREAFSGHALRKRYRFISARDVAWDEHRCSLALAHHPSRRDRMVVARGQSTPHRGRWYDAETRFRRLSPCVTAGWWLWEAEISTGVTHQIRAHAAFVGLPLVGDRIYGGGPPVSVPGGPAEGSFFLHHYAVLGLDARPPASPIPAWWPLR